MNTPHIIETALLLLVAFLIGAAVGYWLRCAFFRPKKRVVSTVAEDAGNDTPVAETIQSPAAQKAPAPESKEVAAKEPAKKKDSGAASGLTDDENRPTALEGPREGRKDDLKRIKGIGPKIENILNKLGIFHFDQIAGWNRKTIDWVDDHLSFRGRIDRENWVEQSKALAAGEETDFSKRVDEGDVPSSS